MKCKICKTKHSKQITEKEIGKIGWIKQIKCYKCKSIYSYSNPIDLCFKCKREFCFEHISYIEENNEESICVLCLKNKR